MGTNNTQRAMIYTDLQTEKMLVILDQVSAQTNSAQQTIEKDWWVTQVLRVLFSLPYAEHLSFKGGHRLAKRGISLSVFRRI